jgi:hypothetical protein
VALAWFITWRTLVIGGSIAGLMGGVVAVVLYAVGIGPQSSLVPRLIVDALTLALLLLYISPVIILRMMFRKHFTRFRLDVVRP